MSAAVRLTGLVALLAGLLAGCSVLEQRHDDVEELGTKIVADWKEQSEVAEAKYDYRHGIDQGQIMYMVVIVRAESVSDEVVDKLKDIANRDFWESPAYDRDDLSLRFVAYSSDNPPVDGQPEPDMSIRREGLGVPEKVGLDKYGPRPSKR